MKLHFQSHVFLTMGSDGEQIVLPLAQSDSDSLRSGGLRHGSEVMVVLHRLKYGVEARAIAKLASILVEGKERLQVRVPHPSTAAILERGFEDLEEVSAELVTLDEVEEAKDEGGFFNG